MSLLNSKRNTKVSKSFYVTACFSLGFATLPQATLASPAHSEPYIVKQCDENGTDIALYLKGNAQRNWEEDKNGFTIIRNDGCIEYAKRVQKGELAPSGKLVGVDRPPQVSRHLKPQFNELASLNKESITHLSQMPVLKPSLNIDKSGVAKAAVLKNLVVLIRFADHTEEAARRNGYPERVLPTVDEFDILFNAEGGDDSIAPAGSIKDIYLVNSYGQLSLESTIVEWYSSPETEAYWANGRSGLTSFIRPLLEAALDNADASINFSDFDQDNDGYIDAITFVHSGYGAEWGGQDCYNQNSVKQRIWSHKSNLGRWTSEEGVKVSSYNINPALWSTCNAKIGRVGVIAHELGHFFGLPDLYDGSGGSGIGTFGLMGNSWGSDGSQKPPLLSAWSKQKLGFNSADELTVPGKYLLKDNNRFLIKQGYPDGEYLLIEKRQRKTFAGTKVIDNIPKQGDGVAVWHIDESTGNTTEGHPSQNGWPENGNHYKVALLQADGEYQLERGRNSGDKLDLFSANGVSTIGPDTTPNTDSYQDGIVEKTNHIISDVSVPSDEMTFCFNQVGCEGFELVVQRGDGGGSYAAGETVLLVANTTPNEYAFDGWKVTEGSAKVNSPQETNASITIGTERSMVEATYKVIKYPVTVNGGAGGGEFAAGAIVTITADVAAEGVEFDKWVIVEGAAQFESQVTPNTKMTIESGGAVIKATYKSLDDSSGGSINLSFLLGLLLLANSRSKDGRRE